MEGDSAVGDTTFNGGNRYIFGYEGSQEIPVRPGKGT